MELAIQFRGIGNTALMNCCRDKPCYTSGEVYLSQLLVQRDREIVALKNEITHLRSVLEKQGLQATITEAVTTAASTATTLHDLEDLNALEKVMHHHTMHEHEFNEAFLQWKAMFANQYNKYRLKDNMEEEYWEKRQFATKVMFSWFKRLQNSKILPVLTVKLSFFLHFYGCAKPVWKLLSKLKLTLSYEKTRSLLARAQKVDIPRLKGWSSTGVVGVVGADNCAYYNNQQYVRDASEAKFINTINWYWRHDDHLSAIPYSELDVPLLEEDEELSHLFWYVPRVMLVIPREHNMEFVICTTHMPCRHSLNCV